MQLNANSHSLLLFQADCFVHGLTLRSNTVVENLCMRPNVGPAAAGPAGPVATTLISTVNYGQWKQIYLLTSSNGYSASQKQIYLQCHSY